MFHQKPNHKNVNVFAVFLSKPKTSHKCLHSSKKFFSEGIDIDEVFQYTITLR